MGLFGGQQQGNLSPEDNRQSDSYPGSDSRLEHTLGKDPQGIFTSDLSVGEYLLLGESGFEPLGFVFGSSIYHIGFQFTRFNDNQELSVLTQAMYNARELAITRMTKEAEDLGADGIVGVKIVLQTYIWGQNVLEFIATGTAVRSKNEPGIHKTADKKPFTSNLSVQDFYKLLSIGKIPVGFTFGTCVYHIAHQSAMASMKQIGQNQEMATFTTGVYTARELALSRMQADADKLGAIGIVGVQTEIKSHVWGEHATEFLASGTSIRNTDGDFDKPVSVKPSFTLGF